MDSLGLKFISEIVGTFLLILLGTGVVANVALAKNKGFNGGFLMVTFGWGLAVFAGVTAAYYSGAHLNPAVTIGLWVHNPSSMTLGVVLVYISGQLIGAFLGAVGCWFAYKQHFDAEPEPANKLGVFSTGPAIRSYGWNVITEVIGTFVLVFVVISFGQQPGTAIGASLGGPTGYAINPARDLGPRLAHAILPIKGKGSSDWAYSWVPIVGPLIGGAIAGLLAHPLLPLVAAAAQK
mgnify:CR=1 FL=1